MNERQGHARIAVESLDALDGLSPGVRDRLAKSGARKDDPFARLDWFATHAAHPPPGMDPRFYLARTEKGAQMLLPFWADRRRHRLIAMTSVYSLGYAPLFSAADDDGQGGEARDLLFAIARHVVAERPRWHRIAIPILTQSAQDIDALIAALGAQGLGGYRYLRGVNHQCPLEGEDFEGWYAARPSRLRNTIRRRERKLREQHEVTFEISSTPGPELWQDYRTIYAASWKEPERTQDLFDELMQTLAHAGLLRLGILRCDQRPVAAQIWIRSGPHAIIYKLAHDSAFDAASPGSLLTREMARAILGEGGVALVDFGLGDEPYKRDWMRECRPLHGLVLYNRKSLAGWLAHGTRRLAAAIRRPAGS
ncbi:MAG: GNAT family N-acetyltransferase [Rhodothalassiaceae bacterium]